MIDETNEAEASKINEAKPESEAEPSPGPEVVIGDPEDKVEESSPYTYAPGDMIWIHSNHGKYIAVVEEAFDNLEEAEAGYSGSFQAIMKRGPLYSAAAPHYLCFVNNHGEASIGASEPDVSLKSKSEDY